MKIIDLKYRSVTKAALMLFSFVIALLIICSPMSASAAGWRSELYPADWKPGVKKGDGRFLHDFSYAGYHSGEKAIPTNPPGRTYNVTQAPYSADNTGRSDATAAIQKAINDAGNAGGGIVYMPAGTYKLSIPADKSYALRIKKSNIVLRGDGAQTKLYNSTEHMRKRQIILVGAPNHSSAWTTRNEKDIRKITRDLADPATRIPVENVNGYRVGDWIVVRSDATSAFVQEHHMGDKWNVDTHKGITFYRQITQIDSANRIITINAPTRYPVKTRDNARIYKIGANLKEVGLEDFAIGGIQNSLSGFGSEDHSNPGTGGYEVQASYAIYVRYTVNSWIDNVSTFRPTQNRDDLHLPSGGLMLYQTSFTTVQNTSFRKPQYVLGGGNGYMYTMRGQEVLMQNAYASHGRHNYSFGSMWTSGNVIHNSTSADGVYVSDFHMHLSPSNLIDNHKLINDTWGVHYRPHGPNKHHGQVASQTVLWNTQSKSGNNNRIISEQWGWGYVIGTQGNVDVITSRYPSYNTGPTDHVEGVNQGGTLVPQSLYKDQFNRRTGNGGGNGSSPTPPATSTELNLDFGTSSSPVQSGWTRVHPSTNTNVISWGGTRPNSADRGNVAGVNNINRDFVYSSQSSTLKLKVGNGLWNVTINMGDASYPHDNMKVTAEGVVIGNNVTNQAGKFPYVTGNNIRVTDGVLDITFEDTGGRDRNWVMTRLSLSKAESQAQPALTKLDLDFGTSNSPVQSGWTRVHPNTNTSVISWGGTRTGSVDRGSIAGVNNVNRDLVYGSEPAILKLKVGNGLWNITINMGDATGAHDDMKVNAEGVVIGRNVTNQAGKFPYVTGNNIQVTDGVLDITFKDKGGSNPHWVLTRLSLSKQ